MKEGRVKSGLREATGMMLAVLGAFLLIATFAPLINPAQFSFVTGKTSLPVIFYVCGTTISIVLMWWGKTMYKKNIQEQENKTQHSPGA